MAQYQVLARKYRPKNFHELLGQTHVWHALANAIDTGRLHHAYLFTGTRGVGKTTIARILAKCLNCETGTTSQPCGVCDACVSIDEGRFIDLIEIDAASRTKVEDTRDLLENVPYAPTQGRYKVYLIDEVHMLSTHSFNALLKTLEEPPEHVKFILATTDPQKLPITIVSRCLQFVLRPMSSEQLHEHLHKVLTDEQIAFTDNALWQLAQSAKGSVRDALSLTDQAIAFGGGRLDDGTVASMLGLVDSLDVLTLISDIFYDHRPQVARHIERMRSQMVDAVGILDKLVDSFHQMALMQILPDVPLDMNDEQKQAFRQLAQAIPSDVLQLYYEISTKARDSVRFASTPMQALEMGILRLLTFRPLATNEIVQVTESPITSNFQSDDELENIEPNRKLSHEDLVHEDLVHEDLVHEDLVHEDLVHEDLAVSQNTEIPKIEKFDENQIVEIQEIKNQSEPNLDQNTLQNLPKDTPPDTDNNPIIDKVENIVKAEVISQVATQNLPDANYDTKKHPLYQEFEPPVMTLMGEWDLPKWDYWTHEAYQSGYLTAEEFALVAHATMTGEIGGEAVLTTAINNYQIEASFNKFAKKFSEQFGGQVRLQQDNALDLSMTPNVRHEQRRQMVLHKATMQLANGIVMDYLAQNDYLGHEPALALSQTKPLYG